MKRKVVSYDSRSMIIDGQRQFIISGEIHYPHSTPSMWPELMRRSKEMGINTIQSYVFWNLHERKRGEYDFEDRLDLVRFIECVMAYDMNLVLRLGPYICAETNYGGFPCWLRDLPDVKMRTYNAVFMTEMGRWLDFIIDKITPYLGKNGGPIIMVELENEYDLKSYGDAGVKYCQWWMKKFSDWDLQIPTMTNHTMAGAINTIHGFTGADDVDRFRKEHPELPILWTENWPGWYSTWGYPRQIRLPEEEAFQNVKFYGKGGSGINWYMWYGGTHFAREGMYLQTPAYGFNTPLDEYGYPTTMGMHIKRFNNILLSHARIMLDSELPPETRHGEGLYSREFKHERTALMFIWNDSKTTAHEVSLADGLLSIPPRGAVVMKNSELIFASHKIARQDTVARDMKPCIRFSGCDFFAEPQPTLGCDGLKKIEHPTPLEQLSLTHDQTDYCWYSTRLEVTKPYFNGLGELYISGCADLLHVFIDGEYMASSTVPLLENRGSSNSPAFSQTIRMCLKKGIHDVSILCCSLGMIKHSVQLGMDDMIEEKKGIWGSVYWKGEEINHEPWSMEPFLSAEDQDSYKSMLKADLPWQVADALCMNTPLSWYRLTFAGDEAEGDGIAVDMKSMTKGMMWLNGQCVSRYWLLEATGEDYQTERGTTLEAGRNAPTQRYYHLPKEWITSHNELVVFEEVGGNPLDISICKWESLALKS